MKSLILTMLGTAAFPAIALAHPGHIAETGQGHAHWLIYLLLGCALFGLAAWARTALSARSHAKQRR